VRDRVREDPRFCLGSWSIALGALPEWVTPEIRSELERIDLGGEEGSPSLFDGGALDRVKERLERSPWVREVSRIRLRYPTFEAAGVIDVELILRVPVALVEHGGLYYLADREGTRLGNPYREAPTVWFGVPAVVCIPAAGQLPDAGGRWTSRDVLQGLEVAKVLHESGIPREFPSRRIDSIDLSNLHGRKDPRKSEIVLWSGSLRLTWGRSPISSGARSVSVKDILANLRDVLASPDSWAHYVEIHLNRPQGNVTGVRG
jgi:hypothetical protein